MRSCIAAGTTIVLHIDPTFLNSSFQGILRRWGRKQKSYSTKCSIDFFYLRKETLSKKYLFAPLPHERRKVSKKTLTCKTMNHCRILL